MLTEILRPRPLQVAAGAAGDVDAVRRLGGVVRQLIRGHVDRELRSVRYLEQLRRNTRRLRHRLGVMAADEASPPTVEP